MQKIRWAALTALLLLLALGICLSATFGTPYLTDALLCIADKTSGHAALSEWLYLRALELSPGDLSARIALAAHYDAQERASAAEALLLDGIEQKPESAELYLALSRLYVQRQQSLEAAELLDGVTSPSAARAIARKRPEIAATPQGGRYRSGTTLTLECSPTAVCYYEIGGQWKCYGGPITLEDGHTTVRAYAVSSEDVPSRIQTWQYELTPRAVSAGELQTSIRCPYCGRSFHPPRETADLITE